ncbi:ATP-binding protein [Streptomyces sp. NBC_00237]|uniref:ATP-binding protein n=1 Tax=Streptomyces sp. NBC_00237 TaxID=2975687 RepID=UPI0022554D11|nr:ATP-binding protein [Streptomyces sp. NBC_00237]MCX5204165.1 ATP-binding protein [Streptomyces sp. NBC_00237]
MDPMNRGPEEHGQDNIRNHDERDTSGSARERDPAHRDPAHRDPAGHDPIRRDPMTRDLGPSASPSLARTIQFTSGDFLLTVNPVDGSEIEPCPPGERPAVPVRRPAADRAELARAAKPPVPPGPAVPELPLLERQEEHEQLVGLLSRGRSVRLVGSPGSGRTALLDAVAEECAELAPDGVVRLSGHRRTAAELLQNLFAAVFRAPLHRPDRDELLGHVHEIGAIVVLDDLEFGGEALEELLAATPECAFLLATTPEAAAETPAGFLEEVLLGGLGRGASLELLERAVDRPLTDEEANWAGDLWFESEGLPLRFVQAGALLRQRDVLRADPGAFDEYGYFTEAPLDAPFDAEDGHDVPLPTLAEGIAPVAPLAARLSESARDTLRFALALGGEVPHQAHLPALVGDTHADAALGELVASGLLSPSGASYRLAAGVAVQLENAGYGDDAVEHAFNAAQHYAWWAGHPSVTAERISAESDAVLSALAALVPGTEAGHPSAAVLLARTAAPAFAAGMQWGAWERSLRTGAEAARIAGEVGEEAYFHHELGILALCSGQLDRARAELETSVGLRGALSDRRGTVAARRALALVTDRSGGARPPLVLPSPSAGSVSVTASRSPFDSPFNPFENEYDGYGSDRPSAGEEMPAARYEESASPPAGVPASMGADELTEAAGPVVIRRSPSAAGGSGAPSRHSMLSGARRNLVAAGAGALLVAVLGTVVTLGATGNNPIGGGDRVSPEQSANEDSGRGGLDADKADGSSGGNSTGGGKGPADPGIPAADSTSRGRTTPGATSDPGSTGKPDDKPGRTTPPPTSGKPTDPPTKPPTTDPPTKPPTTDPPTKPPTTDPPTKPPTTDPPTKPPTTDPPTKPPTTDPGPPTTNPDPPTTKPDPPTTKPTDDKPPTGGTSPTGTIA